MQGHPYDVVYLLIGTKMFSTLKSLRELHMVAPASKPLCGFYWVGFSATDNNQEPIKLAFSFKGPGI